MSERQRNLIVGLTTLIGVVGLVLLLMVFGYLPAILERGYRVRIDLPRAGGVYEGSRIKFAGIDVGVVEQVTLETDPRPHVVVTARIRSEVSIPREVAVSVATPLLGGGASIDLLAPESMTPPVQPLPTDGSARLQGEIPNFADAVTGRLRGAIQQPIEDLHRITAQFEALSAQWTAVGRNINALVEARDPGAVDRGDARGNLATVLARMDRRLAELEQVLAGVDAYVNDPALRADVRQTAANARRITETAADGIEALQERYLAVADSLSAAIDSMKKTVDQVRRPDGTLGKMLADPSLYDNLNDATVRMQQAIDDFRLLVQKWKAEGLPVDLF